LQFFVTFFEETRLVLACSKTVLGKYSGHRYRRSWRFAVRVAVLLLEEILVLLKGEIMAFDSQAQRRIMGCFATGVTVVTTYQNGEIQGMTANAVTSLSLAPPLVLVAVDKTAAMHASLNTSRRFALNILTEAQESLSRRFAMRGPKEVTDLKWIQAASGAPILAEALGYVDCRLTEILPGGDHDIFIGEILAGDVRDDGLPLLFYRGKYRRLAE
jgi:flavin reductase